MLDWLRRLIGTRMPQPSALETAFLAQSQALIDLAHKQQETLDRIVAARFDRPYATHTPQEPNATMPEYMLNDQTSVVASLTLESDDEFLKTVGVQ